MNGKKTKLAVLLRDFSGGGAERSMISIANGLSAAGFRVSLVVFQASGPFTRFIAPTVEVRSLNCRTRGIGTVTAIWPLKTCLNELQPDIVLSTLESTTIAMDFARRLADYSPELILRVATTFSLDQRTFLRGAIIRRIYRAHDGIFVTNSHGSRRNLIESLEIDPAKVNVIQNGVDLQLIKSLAHGKLADTVLKNGRPFFLNAGRLAHPKRQDVLIAAFSEIHRDIEENLVILGEGPLRRELEMQIASLGLQNRVFLIGFVENPYPYFAHASAFVLSSEYEGMPTVLIEALACNCQVVSTDCPSGPAEVLENGKWGQLVPVGNISKLATAMRDLTQKQSSPPGLEARAQQLSVCQTCELYEKLIGTL